MKTVNVPTRAEVSFTNQALFDSLHKGLGFVPNLYATLAHSETALGTYLALQNAKSSLNAKEREVSHGGGCLCLPGARSCTKAAHSRHQLNGRYLRLMSRDEMSPNDSTQS